MSRQRLNNLLLHFLLLCSGYIITCEGVCNCRPGEECKVIGTLEICVAARTSGNTPSTNIPTRTSGAVSDSNTTQATVGAGRRINDVCDPNYELPSTEHECSLFCGRGVCRSLGDGTASCSCDTNASGPNCLRICCKSCGESGKCVRGVTYQELCMCHPLFRGEFCDIYDPVNVCNTVYQPPPLSLRDCGHGLTCVNGICANGTDGSVYCECVPGARGRLCGEVCCLNCGIHGACGIHPQTGNEACLCKAGYTGRLCNTLDTFPTIEKCSGSCCLDCGDHGICDVNAQTGNETCVCEAGFTGRSCDTLIVTDKQEVTWVYWVVGACVLLLVLLIVAIVVVSYVFWKKRVIMVMRVVHFFQHYEDDDNRKWDAVIFVKGNTTEEDFVNGTLGPKLENEMGFKIYIHRCGSNSEDEKLAAEAEKSRRTVFVISPNSKTTLGCEAAEEKISQMKGRIITISLEDVNISKDSTDDNLKTVFDAATSIQWPRADSPKEVEKFWTRLQLVMPKKKNKHEFLNDEKQRDLDPKPVVVKI